MKTTDWKDDIEKKYLEDSMECRTLSGSFDTLISDIESLLKKQRENCAEEYMKLFENCGVIDKITWQSILNAPEPGGGSE